MKDNPGGRVRRSVKSEQAGSECEEQDEYGGWSKGVERQSKLG